jgi:arylsulfatase
MTRNSWFGLLASVAVAMAASAPAAAQQQQKPNILFIMGDDIGWMQPSIYHQGYSPRSTGCRRWSTSPADPRART